MTLKAVTAAVLLVASPTLAGAQMPDERLVGLSRAVGVAEHHLAARGIEGELKTSSRDLVYEIDLVRGTTLHRARVDARSGKLLSVSKPRIENFARSWIDGDRLKRGGEARPLAAQLQGLEQRTGGTVTEVAFELRKGRGVYEVELATAAGVGKVHIDASTGQRLALAIDE